MRLPDWEEEVMCWNKGYKLVCGIDEVGRGSLAGPVVAAAVVFAPFTNRTFQVRDSKTLSRKQREELVPKIKELAFCYGIGVIQSNEVDKIGIVRATHQAMIEAINSLDEEIDFCIIDGPSKIVNFDDKIQKALVKGDNSSYSIASASVLAKVYRDNLMYEYHKKYPEYGFDTHVGYGTKKHREAIKNYGLTPLHRKSFLKNILDT